MIISQLSGGLGNQMFQYAMGKSLALRNQVELGIDLSFYENYEWHDYSLSPFSITASVIPEGKIVEIKKHHASIINRVQRKIFGYRREVIYEKSLTYDPEYKNIKDPAYLIGYWQCEEYFKEYQDIIRKEFTVKAAPTGPNEEALRQIRASDSVSLHIRRGNYVAYEHLNKLHGTTSLEYYHEAVERISQSVSEPVFYIFSDDIAWARSNLRIDYPAVFVDWNDDKSDYEDMRLMSACKHHILANSTFSWWGAWLNPSPDKIVIAPVRWFADEKKNSEGHTIVPSAWLRI